MTRQIAEGLLILALAILTVGVAGIALTALVCDLYGVLRTWLDRAETDLPDADDEEDPYVVAA